MIKSASSNHKASAAVAAAHTATVLVMITRLGLLKLAGQHAEQTGTSTHTVRKTPDHRNQIFLVPVCSSGQLQIKCGAWSKILIRAVSGVRAWHCDSDCRQIMKTQSSIWDTNFSLTVCSVIYSIIRLQNGGLDCIWHIGTHQILFSVWPLPLTRTPKLASYHHHHQNEMKSSLLLHFLLGPPQH